MDPKPLAATVAILKLKEPPTPTTIIIAILDKNAMKLE
jgi:hypothetical protein